jgi:hypothetical protein
MLRTIHCHQPGFPLTSIREVETEAFEVARSGSDLGAAMHAAYAISRRGSHKPDYRALLAERPERRAARPAAAGPETVQSVAPAEPPGDDLHGLRLAVRRAWIRRVKPRALDDLIVLERQHCGALAVVIAPGHDAASATLDVLRRAELGAHACQGQIGWGERDRPRRRPACPEPLAPSRGRRFRRGPAARGQGRDYEKQYGRSAHQSSMPDGSPNPGASGSLGQDDRLRLPLHTFRRIAMKSVRTKVTGQRLTGTLCRLRSPRITTGSARPEAP